jgi:hypothetical protein
VRNLVFSVKAMIVTPLFYVESPHKHVALAEFLARINALKEFPIRNICREARMPIE